VFVNSRKACQQAAEQIKKDYIQATTGNSNQLPPWKKPEVSLRAEDKSLNELLPYGIGFHHAGLPFHDRRLVEANFTDSTLSVVVSTTTLSVHTRGARCWTSRC
jgi:replicative superfamily II helicase